jgi:hypothetical protein
LRSASAPTLELDPRQACASSSSSTRVDIYSRLRVVTHYITLCSSNSHNRDTIYHLFA